MRQAQPDTGPRDRPLVLVADDDEDIRMLVRFRLERSGYDVVSARDRAEALELAVRHRPDLAVLDLMMPKVDGYEVTRRLRDLEVTRRMPAATPKLERLEQLVRLHSRSAPDRADEWRSTLVCLRGYAGLDGRLPRSFDGLVDEVFGELIDRLPAAA